MLSCNAASSSVSLVSSMDGTASATAPSTASSTASASQDRDHIASHHIWLVTGPAGTGKSTLAKYLADELDVPYIEGDEFHPKANVDKMRNNIPLTDSDRWDWLTALREESVRRIAEGGSNAVVLTCSALKRKYRDVIRVAPYFNADVHLHFIFLHANADILLQRVAGRKGHYMGPNMVKSQLEILEPPAKDETDVISVDVGRPLDEIESDIIRRVRTLMDIED